MRRIGAGLEDSLSGLVLFSAALILVAEMVLRKYFTTGIPGSSALVNLSTLWLAFLGAALAAREKKLLSLATGEFLPKGWIRDVSRVLSAAISSLICTGLAVASYELVKIEYEFDTHFDWIPAWIAQLVMPIALAAVAVRLVIGAGSSWKTRLPAAIGIPAGFLLVRALYASHAAEEYPVLLAETPALPGVLVVLGAAILGAPVFVVIAGIAGVLFVTIGDPLQAIPSDAYGMATKPHLAAIPLFTLTGFLLAEGDVPARLLRLFRAFFGWMPGGTAIVCATLCAFLTVFTGGSGVTILVLGGILFQALNEDGYRERFSLGLLTASGSLGLLLPPALPLILYGVVANVPIKQLFVGGILPGVLLVALIAAWGVREGLVGKTSQQKFDRKEATRALWAAKFEIAIPVIVLGAIFSGWATLVESAALTALVAFVLQLFIHKNISFRKDLNRVVRECVVLTGGVLIILAMAYSLTNYITLENIPGVMIDWMQERVESKWVFLLCVNIFLLLVGCMMDIFSATVVVVPLLVPLGAAYGVDPVHLGIIFIANLELGYLTPPVGLNLFLASYRFKKPLLSVYRAALPMLLILGLGVLAITYIPWLTTALVGLFDLD